MIQVDEPKNLDLSIVIPCFNEEESLVELVRRVSAVCNNLVPLTYEIVLVNDGSRDKSWDIISGFASDNDHVVGINLARNYGHQIALSAGLQICSGQSVMVMDADLQDPPELLPDLLAKMADGNDVVYGQRIARQGETLFKRTSASLFYSFLQKMIDVDVPRDTGDFRIMSRRVVDHLNAMPERFRFVRGMVSWIGYNQAPLYYEREPRFAGESHYPVSKMIGFAVDAVTSFSTLPLRFAAHIGLLVGVAGVMTLGWVLASWLTGHTLAGWTSMLGTILLLGSVQLMVLGIFGEYLGRMYMESKHRPLFIIREVRAKPNESAIANPVHELSRKLKEAVNG